MVWARWALAVVVGAALIGGGAAVVAQEAPVRIVQASDGTLYLLKGGGRFAIAVGAIEDEELAGYADGGTLAGAELVAALSSAPPASAVTRTGAATDRTQAVPPDATPPDQPAAPEQQGVAPNAPQPDRGATAVRKSAASGAPQFVRIQGAAPGGTASVTVLSAPGATCSLSYRTPAGTASTASGLGQQTADASGSVTWSFTIGSNTQPGVGSLIATCGSASANTTIQIGTPGLSR